MSNKKIVGLINLQRCDSHGAVLLAYALEKVIKEFGFDVQIIDYIHGGRISKKKLIRKIFIKIRYIIKKKFKLFQMGRTFIGKSLRKEYYYQHERFVDFRNNYLSISKEVSNPDDDIFNSYDAMIVGSDVVWKPEIANSLDQCVYFLKVGRKDCVKIAYAASVGTDDKEILNKNYLGYVDAFNSLDFISIREQSMIDFVKTYTERNVVSVIDPVFLLEKETYTAIEKRNIKMPCEYVYVYIIGDNRKAIEEANGFAKNENLGVLIDLNDGFNNERIVETRKESAISAGPLEFLYNIRNAKYVITDSYHATAFSLIFNIPFTVFDRGKISVRMKDLINRFEISDRRYINAISVKEIDWNRINNQISIERNIGKDYLREALFYDK